MKAVVRKSLKAGALSIEELPVPAISEHEALVRVKAVGVCGTDAHIYTGEVVTDIPVVVGHEFCGIVEKTGTKVSGISVGDRVVSRLNLGVCGKCRACVSGNPQMCAQRTCPGFKLDGAYAEYIKMDASMLIVISDRVPFEEAAVTEPMAIVAHGLLERTKVEPEDTVVVFGPGPIGLLAVQMAKLNGAARVIAVGTDIDTAKRLPLAKKTGADFTLNASEVDVESVVKELTGEQGVDLVVEASGSERAINSGLRMLRRQGRMCILGLPGTRENRVEWLTAAEKSLSLIFSYSSSPLSWNLATSMLERGAIDVSSLISHVVPMEKFHEAFQDMASGKGIKFVLVP